MDWIVVRGRGDNCVAGKDKEVAEQAITTSQSKSHYIQNHQKNKHNLSIPLFLHIVPQTSNSDNPMIS